MSIQIYIVRKQLRDIISNKTQNTKGMNLIFITSFLTGRLGVGREGLVILFQAGKILTGLGKFSLFHTLSDVPVDESTLGVHEIELVVDAGESLGNGGGVGNHANGTGNLGHIATGDRLGSFVVDSALESGRAPVDELNGALGLDGGNSGVDVLGDDISTVHEAASHVLSVTRVALGHHVGWLEDRAGNLGNREALVEGLVAGDDRSVRGQHKVDTRVRNQVGLELGDINVQGTIETKRGGQGRNDLGNQTIQVGVGRLGDIELTSANIVESLVVQACSAVSVLQESMGREDRVVRLDNSGRNLRGRRNGKGQLGLAAIVDGKTFQQEGSQTRSGTSSSGVEDEESLQSGTVVGKLADTVQDRVNNLLSNGVVTTGVVVGSILLSTNDLLGVVKLGVGSGADFVTNGGLQIHVESTRDVLSGGGFGEEGVVRIVGNSSLGNDFSVRGDSVLQAVEFPALVTDLDTGLTEMDRDTF